MNSIWNTAAASQQNQLNSIREPGLDPAFPGKTSRSAALPGKAETATMTSGTASSALSDSITSNDFLTLLVTEMQNQDPTAQTDPNQYINQLVQINSLEQLISINQNLATVLKTASTTTPPGTASTRSAQIAQPSEANLPVSGSSGYGLQVKQGSGLQAGNLSAPGGKASANVVAHSLDGRHSGTGHAIRDIPTR